MNQAMTHAYHLCPWYFGVEGPNLFGDLTCSFAHQFHQSRQGQLQLFIAVQSAAGLFRNHSNGLSRIVPHMQQANDGGSEWEQVWWGNAREYC